MEKKSIFKIGNLELKHPTVPAPMAGLTDIAFRKLLDDLGYVGYMVTEMISADGLIRRNTRTFEMMRLSDFKTPQFIQLFGNDIDSIKEAVKIVNNETEFYGIDFNMGCPASKVVKKGAGSALLKNLDQVKRIVESLRESTTLPLTIKIRLGFEKINIFDSIKIIDENGADAIAIHFRLRHTPYLIPAKWEFAEEIKKITDKVIIGNGDIFDYRTAIERLNTVDAIMIGRGAISNPLIFSEIAQKKKSTIKKKEIFLKLIDLIEHYYEEKLKLPKLKPFIRYMISEKPDSKSLRLKLYNAKDIREAKNIFISSQ